MYGRYLDEALKLTNINKAIWEYSVNHHLSHGKEYTLRASTLSLNSPFSYNGNKTKQEILDIYNDAVNFAIDHICKSNKTGTQCLYHIIQSQKQYENEEEDIHQCVVIVFDFVVQDYILHNYGISGTEFKSAICAFGIQEDDSFKALIQRLADQLDHQQ